MLTKEQLGQLVDQVTKSEITAEYYEAVVNERDTWVPACGGKETWTPSRTGRMFLYVFNPAAREHGWLNQSDIVETESPYGV